MKLFKPYHPFLRFLALIFLLLMANYWISLFLATFVSRSPLVLEPALFILSLLVAGAALGVLWRNPSPPAEAPLPAVGTSGDILRAEWRRARPDLPGIWAVTGLIFLALAWSHGPGFAADGNWFLFNYLQMNDSDPVYYAMLLYWGPLSSLVYGLSLDGGGLPLLMALQLGLALGASTALYLWARAWGRNAALLLLFLWWLYLPAQLHHHLIGADGLMVALIPLWLYALRLAVQHQKAAFWLGVGVLVGLLALTRAGNLLMIVCLAGALLPYRPTKALAGRLALALLGLALVISPHILNLGLRYDYWGLSRGSNTLWWAAVYVPNSIVELDNGPATRRYAEILEDELLNTDLYQGVTVEQFFSTPSYRTYDDGISVLDRAEGWESEYALLRPVAWEAIRAHPAAFLRYAIGDFIRLMGIKEALPGLKSNDPALTRQAEMLSTGTYQHFLSNHPSGRIPDPEQVAAARAQFAHFTQALQTEARQGEIFRALNELWLRFGTAAVWWFAALPLAFWLTGRPKWGRQYLLAAALGVGVVVIPAALSNPEPRYRLPFDPLMLLALALCLEWFSGRLSAQ